MAKCQVHFNQYITWGLMPSTCRGRASKNEIFLAPSNSKAGRTPLMCAARAGHLKVEFGSFWRVQIPTMIIVKELIHSL